MQCVNFLSKQPADHPPKSAAKTIDDDLGTRTRVMTRKLREVEGLPQKETDKLLGLTNGGKDAAEDENSENEGDEE